MKLRFSLMAVVSVIAIGATTAIGAGPALANQTDEFSIVNGAGKAYYMVTGSNPIIVEPAIMGGASFSNINGTQKSILGASEPVYEWQAYNVTWCWTYDSGSGNLILQPCRAGDTTQLFWQPVDGQADRQFINVYASNTHGEYYCVNASHAASGADVNVIPCKSKSDPGGFDQYWYPY